MIQVQHDTERHRFVAPTEGEGAFLLYAPLGPGRVDFQSTYVPPALRGQGIGERVVRAALDWARAEQLHVVPTCWFVGEVVDRLPEYRDLLAPV